MQNNSLLVIKLVKYQKVQSLINSIHKSIWYDRYFIVTSKKRKLDSVSQRKQRQRQPKKDKNVPYDQKRAWNYSLWLLGRQLYTRKGIEDKLKKKETSPEDIEIVLDKLVDYKLLDDENYARIYVRSRKRDKGKHALKQELKRKGISEEHIEFALDTLDEAEQRENVNTLLFRNRWRFQDPKKARTKAYAFLQRRGFDSDMIRDALESSFVDGIYDETTRELEEDLDSQALFGENEFDEEQYDD